MAVITENGLWIKDEYNKITNIINSEKIVGDELIDVEITQFNDEFQLDRIIFAEKINIKENKIKDQ